MYERNERNDRSDIESSGTTTQERTGPSPALIALVVLAIATVVFVLRNGERAEIDFLFADVRSRVWVLIAIAIAIGIVLDRLLITWWRRRRR